MAISPYMLKEILNPEEEFWKLQQQLLTMMTRQFSHQLEILQERKNLNTNSVDYIEKKSKTN